LYYQKLEEVRTWLNDETIWDYFIAAAEVLTVREGGDPVDLQYEGEPILNQSKKWIVKLLLPTDPTITADNPTFYDPTLQERVEALRDGVTHRIQRASDDSATGSSTGTPRHQRPPHQRSIKADLDELYNIRLALEAVEQR